MSCGVGYGCGLDLALLWLGHRRGSAAQIQPLAWKRPHATGAALRKKERKKKKEQPKITPNTTIQQESRLRSSHCGLGVMNLTGIHEDTGLLPGLAQ